MLLLLLLITGCGDNKDSSTNNDGNETKETNETYEVTETTEDVVNDKMTLENFKKVMKEHGLSVVAHRNCEESVSCSYMAYDDREGRRTSYLFQIYENEGSATSSWNNLLSSIYEHYDSYNFVFKDEENRKLEYSNGTSGIRTNIHYYDKTTSLSVDNDDSDNKDSLNYVKEVLEEFGYTFNIKTDDTSSSDDEINN